MLQTLRPEKATLPRLVAGFFREILIQDPDIHEDLEMQIDALEKEVFDARAPHFRQQTLQLGKELLTLNRYYEQLININAVSYTHLIRARVYEELTRQKEEEEGAVRRAKIGTGDRSEKIRTCLLYTSKFDIRC